METDTRVISSINNDMVLVCMSIAMETGMRVNGCMISSQEQVSICSAMAVSMRESGLEGLHKVKVLSFIQILIRRT